MKMESQAKILICDENTEERGRLASGLIKAGFRYVDEACDGESALHRIDICMGRSLMENFSWKTLLPSPFFNMT